MVVEAGLMFVMRKTGNTREGIITDSDSPSSKSGTAPTFYCHGWDPRSGRPFDTAARWLCQGDAPLSAFSLTQMQNTIPYVRSDASGKQYVLLRDCPPTSFNRLGTTRYALLRSVTWIVRDVCALYPQCMELDGNRSKHTSKGQYNR